MARPLRIEYDGAVYHICARGNEKCRIFYDSKDKAKFFSYLQIIYERYGVLLYGYCLMQNHYHLLLTTPESGLSRALHDLNGGYTVYFNRRHKRVGHLFQGRFKALLVQRERYLLKLLRYIHLNPVKSNCVRKPEEYADSSMNILLRQKSGPQWLDAEFVLSQFGNSNKLRINNFKKFIYEGLNDKYDPFEEAFAQSILGDKAFIEEMRKIALSKEELSQEIPQKRKLKYGKDLTAIASGIKDYYKDDGRNDRSKRLDDKLIKKIIVYFARKYSKATLQEIADYFHDGKGPSSFSKMFARFESVINNNAELEKEIKKIFNFIFSG